ncbi:MAG: hypothetical protein PUB08_02940 [Firmicutes bacterium]|nr:hypothetical protein [Bacillota bacterium]
MKRRLLAFAIVVVLMLSVVALPTSAAAEMKIYRLATAPVLDGAIGEGEYYLLADNSTYNFGIADNSEGDMAKADKKIYAGYDDNYLYLAAAVTCETHINEWVFVADGGENDYDIYDGHSAMIGITSVNPATDADCIATLTNSEWTWSDAFKSAIGREFTIAQTSDTGIQLSGVHFSHTIVYVPESDIYTDPVSNGTIRYNAANDANLPMTTDFFKVAHDASNYDIYEVKVPWGWIDYKTDKKGNKGENVIPFDRKDGTYCGVAIDLASGDIDQDVYFNQGLAHAYFGCTSNQNLRYFGEYVPLYLSGNADAGATASAKLGTPGSSSSNSGVTAVGTTTTSGSNVSDTTTGTKPEATTNTPKTTTKKVTTTTKTADADKTVTEEKDGLSGGAIALIVIAVLVVVAVVVVIIVKKKKGAANTPEAPKAEEAPKADKADEADKAEDDKKE